MPYSNLFESVSVERVLKLRIKYIALCLTLIITSCGTDDGDEPVADTSTAIDQTTATDMPELTDNTFVEDVAETEDITLNEDTAELDVLDEVEDVTPLEDVPGKPDALPPKDTKPGKDILPPKDSLPPKDGLPPKDKGPGLDIKPAPDSLLPPKDTPAIGLDSTCTPDCEGKQCGPNGCGGECGQCADDEICSPIGNCKPTPPFPFACDINDFNIWNQSVSMYGGQNIGYAAYSSETYPTAKLTLEFFPSSGGPTQPGIHTIGGSNYSNCGLCILIKTYTENASTLNKTFYAKSGVLDITSMAEEGNFTGSIQNLLLMEVTIGQDFTSVPVPGGESWCISNLDFDAPFAE